MPCIADVHVHQMSRPWPFTRQWGSDLVVVGYGRREAVDCSGDGGIATGYSFVTPVPDFQFLSKESTTLAHSQLHLHTVNCTCTQSTTLAHSQLHLHTVNYTCTQSTTFARSQLHLHAVNYTCTQSSTLVHGQRHLHTATTLAHSQRHLHTVNYTCTQSTTLAHSQLHLHTVNYTCTQSTFNLFQISRYMHATILHTTQHSIQLMPKYILHSRTKPI